MSDEAKRLKEIQQELETILQQKRTIRLLDDESLRGYQETLKVLKKNNGSIEAFQKELTNVKKELAESERAIYGISGALGEAVDELMGMNAGLNRARKAFRGLESIADKLANDQSDIARMSLKDLKTVEEKIKAKAKELIKSQSSLKLSIRELQIKKKNEGLSKAEDEKLKKYTLALKAVNTELSKEGNLRQYLIQQANERIAAEEEIIKVMGAAPAILEGAGKALQKIGLPDFGISEAVKNTRDIIRLKNEEYDITHQVAVEEKKAQIAKRLENTLNLRAQTKTANRQTKYIKQQVKQGKLSQTFLNNHLDHVKKLYKQQNKNLKQHFKEKENLKNLVKSGAERVSSTKAFSTLLGQVGKKIKDQLTTANLIQGAFTLLVSAMMQLDKLTGTLAKNVGLSYDESLELQRNFNQIAIDSDNIMVSTTALNESFTSLNQRFQGATGFSNEMLESFTALTKQAGFSAETIGNMAAITGTQGKELENNLALMQGQLTVMNAQNGTSFSEKQLVEDIGKINKATLLTLRNQPKALARTLMTSKQLVLSFAEMESISSSLLDFEGSLQAELEAELLTGKQINLEQARLLALKGDIAGAAAEVAKQVGNAAEFENMNVIQQEALAKAAGLTREQLANSLMEREALAKLGGQDKTALEAYNRLKKEGLSDEAIATRLGDDRLAKQLKSQSVQERFAASVERLKEIFVDVGQALMPIVSAIADGIVSVSKFVATFGPFIKFLGKAYLLIKGIQASFLVIKFLGDSVYRTRILSNAAAKLGLITEQQSVLAQRAAAMQGNKIMNIRKMKAMYEKQSLFNVLKENLAKKAQNALDFINLQFSKDGFVYTKLKLLKQYSLNALKAVGNALGLTSLSTTVAQGAAETVITANKQTQTRLMPGIIAKGLTYLGTLVAQAAAAIASASALTLGIGTVAILAAVAAGVAYLYSISKPKKAGDMMMANGKTQVSPAEGGLFELSGNDQFVAAPGIADAVTGRNRSQRREDGQQRREQRREERQNDNAKLEQSMNRTNQILAVVANNLKPKPLLGSESGQAINNGSYALN